DCLQLGYPLFELVIQVSDLLFRGDLPADIGARPKPTNHRPVRITNGDGTGKKPAILPILSQERRCFLPRLACLPGALNALNHSSNVVRVMESLPLPSLHLFK